MSDDTNVTPAMAGAESVESTKAAVTSSSTGKIIAVIAGLGLLAIIVGVVAAVVLSTVGGRDADEFEVQIDQAVSDTAGSEEAVDAGKVPETAAPAIEVEYSEIFTFRDIFDPLIKPIPEEPVASTTSTSTASATDTATPYAQGVLYLDGIESVDGVMKAVLRYNGQTYTLAAGEGIPGTPWEVFSVSSSGVTMLYGDNKITLVTGQGITK